ELVAGEERPAPGEQWPTGPATGCAWIRAPELDPAREHWVEVEATQGDWKGFGRTAVRARVGFQAEPIRVVLEAPARLHGFVVDEHDARWRGVVVQLVSEGGTLETASLWDPIERETGGWERTDWMGEFHLEASSAGRHALRLRAPFSEAREKEVVVQGDTELGKLVLRRGERAELHGTVTVQDPKDSPDVLVVLREPRSGTECLERIRSDGKFTFSEVPLGSYELDVI